VKAITWLSDGYLGRMPVAMTMLSVVSVWRREAWSSRTNQHKTKTLSTPP